MLSVPGQVPIATGRPPAQASSDLANGDLGHTLLKIALRQVASGRAYDPQARRSHPRSATISALKLIATRLCAGDTPEREGRWTYDAGKQRRGIRRNARSTGRSVHGADRLRYRWGIK